MKRLIFAVGACIALSGCATIIEGTTQSIAIVTDPPDTACVVTREGQQIATIEGDRKFIKISKSRHDIAVTCNAPGYKPGTVTVSSSLTAAGTVSIMAIDLGATDYATGALNSYPETVAVNLSRDTAKQVP